MSWLSKATGVHVHVDPVEVVNQAVQTAGQVGAAAANTALQVAKAPTVVLVAASQGDIKKIEDTVKDMAKSMSSSASAMAQAASSPYILAANIADQVGGDGAKILRGVIAEKLVEINIVPILIEILTKKGLKIPDDIVTAPVAAILAAYLTAAHDVLEPAASTLPNSVRKLMKGHYPDDIINKAKYIVSAFGLTLPEAINGSNVYMGQHAFAVTVGNVIVFSETPASDDAGFFWWGHELQHVVQYDQLGIDGFADAYVHNYKKLEEEADAKGKEIIESMAD